MKALRPPARRNRVYVVVWIIFALLCLLAAPTLGDEIQLANGDRMTGEIVRMETDVLVLKTSYAGEVEVQWQDVVCMRSDTAHTFRLKDGEVIIGQPRCPGEGKVQIVGVKVGETAEIPLDDLEAVNPSPPPPPIQTKGSLTGAGSASTGNTDEASAYFSADFLARSERHRLTLGGKYNYGESDGEITTRNALGRMKYDFFISQKIYAYAQGLLENDEFQDLNLRSTAGVGAGYQFIETERTSLFGEAGISYFDENFEEAEDDSFFTARESAGVDFQIVREKIIFFHLHELYWSLENSNDYYFRAEQGLRFHLLGNLFAHFGVDYRYDRTPAPGKKNADTAYVAGLSYQFRF